MVDLDLSRISVALPPLTGPALPEFAREVERFGFGWSWTNDQYHSALVAAGAIAVATERIAIGTAVAQAFVRSPLVTALSAMDVAALCDGRFRLGLGSGVRRLVEGWHGVPYGKPAARLRECAELVRRIMGVAPTGEAIRWLGEHYQVDIAGYRYPSGGRRHIPILLTGVRPGMVQVAAEVADGFIGHPAFTPMWIAGVVRPALRAGASRRRPGLGALQVIARAAISIDSDGDRARTAARTYVADLAAGRAYTEIFQHAGFAEAVAALRADPTATALVTEPMVDAFTVSGEPPDAFVRLADRMRGVDELLVSPAQSHSEDPGPFLQSLRQIATGGCR